MNIHEEEGEKEEEEKKEEKKKDYDDEEIIRSRLSSHDKNRVMVQKELKEACTRLNEEIDSLETRIWVELNDTFETEDTKQQEVIQKLKTGCSDNVTEIEHYEVVYEIFVDAAAKSFSNKIVFRAKKLLTEEDREKTVLDTLLERAERHHESKVRAGEKLTQECSKLRNEVEALESKVNEKLEVLFIKEDARLQTLLNNNKVNNKKSGLVVIQSYELIKNKYTITPISDMYELRVIRRIWKLNERKYGHVTVKAVTKGRILLNLNSMFSEYEQSVLTSFGMDKSLITEVYLREKDGDELFGDCILNAILSDCAIDPPLIKSETVYTLKLRVKCCGETSEWSDPIEFRTPAFKECCSWKKCPAYASEDKKYSVNRKNPRIATKIGALNCMSVILGNTVIPQGRTVRWSVKVLKSMDNECAGIYVGVAPYDVDVNKDDVVKYGWYLDCFNSTLWSGYPQYYSGERYSREQIHTGDVVCVSVDTVNGNISFSMNGGKYRVAFSKVPLYKPLLSCAVVSIENDSIELMEREEENITNNYNYNYCMIS